MSELETMLRNVANNDGKKHIVDSRAGLESLKDNTGDSEWDNLSNGWDDNIASSGSAADSSFDSFESFLGTEPLDPNLNDPHLMEDFNLDDIECLDEQGNQRGNACFCPDEDTDQNTKVKPLGLDLSDDVISGKTSIADTCTGPKDDLIDCSLYNDCKAPEDESFNDDANCEWLGGEVEALTEDLDFVNDLDASDISVPAEAASNDAEPLLETDIAVTDEVHDTDWEDPAFAEFRAKEKAAKEAQALAVQKEDENIITGTTSKGNFQYKCDGDVCTIQASDLIHSDCDTLSVNDLSNSTINADLNLSALDASLGDASKAAASDAEASCPRRSSKLVGSRGASHVLAVGKRQKEHSQFIPQPKPHPWGGELVNQAAM